MSVRLRLCLPLLVIGLPLFSSCAEQGWDDPQAVYDRIVTAVKNRDGGVIYDLLDSTRRSQIDTFIGAQLANIDRLPAEEQPMWEALKGESKRSIYAKVMASDPLVGDIFGPEAKVVRMDTVIYCTVQHRRGWDLLYLRPVGGQLRITTSPEVLVYGPRPAPRTPPIAPDDPADTTGSASPGRGR